MPRYTHEALITWTGHFPMDMLRYDGCCPATERDSAMMTVFLPETHMSRTARVRKIADNRIDGFTEARWVSFGCKIIVSKPRRL